MKIANTGTPTAPRSIQTVIAVKLHLVPSSATAAKTANVCKVIGTVRGIEIQEHTASSAANMAVKAISLTVNTCFFETVFSVAILHTSFFVIFFNVSIITRRAGFVNLNHIFG